MSPGSGQARAAGRKGGVAAAVAVALVMAVIVAPPARATAGDRDTSFGAGNGVARWQVTSKNEFAKAVIHQPDGKIVTAGRAGVSTPGDFSSDWFVSRHNADGSLDTRFGTGGTVATDIGGSVDEPRGVALQPDGKIVVAGSTGDGGEFDTALARYSSNGVLDTTFGGDGIVVLDLSVNADDHAYDVAVDPGGRIVVAGSVAPADASDFAVTAVKPDGTLDATFGGGDGVVTTSFVPTGQTDRAQGLALQSDGKIVVAGEGGGNFAVVRYTASGKRDTAFSGDGKLTSDFGGTDGARDVALDANDRIVAAGFGTALEHLSLARYTPDGIPDTTFSGDGKTSTKKLVDSNFTAADIGLAIQVDGKPVVGGGFGGLSGVDFGAARFTVGGLLDTTFSGDGVLQFDLNADQDYGNDVAIDAVGNIVVAGGVDGTVQNPDGSHDGEAMMVRFLGELAASACPGLVIGNTVTGTPGDDTLVGTPGSDFIAGGGGHDTITAWGGDDCIYGGTGNDVIGGGTGNDRLFSEAGNDTLTGGTGLDKIVAQVGDDVIRVAAGDVPAASTEILKGKGGSDTADLGAGLSSADVTSGAPPTFTVTDPATGGTYSAVKVELITDT